MDINQPLELLAGLSPAQFMRQHWQKKPLLVRQAIAGFKPVLSRAALFKLATREQVESRLIVQQPTGWRMKQGPMGPRALPPLAKPGWTLLVQGVDMHDAAAYALLQQFRFVPDARLDDLMISFATPGGGVGPHFDSYDVFLLQASGQRRWRIGRQKDLTLQPGVPLKILQNFEPEEEYVLQAGDMLYLPPGYAHDGIAESSVGGDGKPADCMTYSVGFRVPGRGELAAELLRRLAEFSEDEEEALAGGEVRRRAGRPPRLYQDPGQPATASPAELPAALADFAGQAVLDALKDPMALKCALGEYMTAPKPTVWFEEPLQGWVADAAQSGASSVHLDARSRMMYDSDHVFINGESYRAKGADARFMQLFANQRSLMPHELRKASASALALLEDWHGAGWLRQAMTERPAGGA